MIVNKLKWIAGFFVVFILILATNLIDKDHFQRIEKSVTTIYEDRLVANDIIYKMSRIISEKSLGFALSDSVFISDRNQKLSSELDQHISDFHETELTNTEAELLTDLENDFQILKQAELNYTQEQVFLNSNKYLNTVNAQIFKINKALDELSNVQMTEGKKQKSIASNSLNLIEMMTRIEIISLIILGIVIQFLVLYKPRRESH